LFFSLSLAS